MSTTATSSVKDLRREAQDARREAEEALWRAERAEEKVELAQLDENPPKLQVLSEAVEDHRRGLLTDQELYDVLDGVA